VAKLLLGATGRVGRNILVHTKNDLGYSTVQYFDASCRCRRGAVMYVRSTTVLNTVHNWHSKLECRHKTFQGLINVFFDGFKFNGFTGPPRRAKKMMMFVELCRNVILSDRYSTCNLHRTSYDIITPSLATTLLLTDKGVYIADSSTITNIHT
jgi:hypothetical protein